MSEAPLQQAVVREAARWYIRLHEAAPEDAQRKRFEQWRSQHPDHERAWQLAQRVSGQWQGIPDGVGLRTLDRADRLSRRDGLKALMLLMTAGAATWVVGRHDGWSADERTAVGEQRQIDLADGTRLNLNTDSAVDIAFDDHQRLIRLRSGEVLVTTGQDPLNRPLRVETVHGNVYPIGTRFSVRLEDDDSLVTVYGGAVDICPTGQTDATRLNVGNQARFDSLEVMTAQPLIPDSDGWSLGVLRVELMPLSTFTRELSRYRPGWVRCDPQIADLLITGAFQLRDTDLILSAVARALPVSVVYRTRYWVTLQPRSA
ncbi:Protein FecR [Pseudomonas reidholzensis]|uniref:Protein FecR n=1 Tax=Pseudomonas reidholzensis TaxID=1785162 RepID=A0A383RX41_9PSED|nr:FecR domain-containing protein [Pseudomonas reidholzensis]SYX91056.1 Protein FecR [Pseudomonas reidholzensis]